MVIACNGGTSHISETDKKQDVATNVSQQKTIPANVQTLKGYFFKNTHKINEDLTILLFQDSTSFSNYLGMARTMDNQIDEPDFVNHIIMAIVCKSIKFNSKISINQTEKINEIVNIYFEVETGEPLSYTMQPLLVFSLVKEKDIKTINFISNGEKVKEITLN